MYSRQRNSSAIRVLAGINVNLPLKGLSTKRNPSCQIWFSQDGGVGLESLEVKARFFDYLGYPGQYEVGGGPGKYRKLHRYIWRVHVKAFLFLFRLGSTSLRIASQLLAALHV